MGTVKLYAEILRFVCDGAMETNVEATFRELKRCVGFVALEHIARDFDG